LSLLRIDAAHATETHPGFEVHKRRVTRILPDAVVMGMLPGIRYDDELDVEW
jgi:hypothetical protein